MHIWDIPNLLFNSITFNQISIMKKPKKVQAPEGCQSYLTAGKVYDVVSCDQSASEEYGYGFSILTDMGTKAHCIERKCAHLNGCDWIVVESQTKRQELYLDPEHPNYTELTNAGLSERDTCEFYVTSDGKAIAFHFDTLDEYMGYLSKLQGSRVECKFENVTIGWKYTDSFCLDNRPDGGGWVKFEITTYADELRKMDISNVLDATYRLVKVAYDNPWADIFFRNKDTSIETYEAERNQMECDGRYMGIVFSLSDVKP